MESPFCDKIGCVRPFSFSVSFCMDSSPLWWGNANLGNLLKLSHRLHTSSPTMMSLVFFLTIRSRNTPSCFKYSYTKASRILASIIVDEVLEDEWWWLWWWATYPRRSFTLRYLLMNDIRERLVNVRSHKKKVYTLNAATRHIQNQIKMKIFSLNRFMGSVHWIVFLWLFSPKVLMVKSHMVMRGKRGDSQKSLPLTRSLMTSKPYKLNLGPMKMLSRKNCPQTFATYKSWKNEIQKMFMIIKYYINVYNIL